MSGIFSKIKDNVILILKGIVIGIADAIPGVSGGTMALILKIYDQLLAAISLRIESLKKNWKFILFLGIGIVIGIVLAAKVLAFLFETYSVPTQLFFMGVVIGSIPLIFKEARNPEGEEKKKFTPICAIPFLLGVAVILGVFFANGGTSLPVIRELTVGNFFLIFIWIIFAAIAMIIPGVSGALVLKAMGGYDTLITAVNELNILILIPAVLGAAVGLLGAAKLLSVLLKKYRMPVYAFILGLIIASPVSIFPQSFRFNTQGIIGVVLFLFGLILPAMMEIKKK